MVFPPVLEQWDGCGGNSALLTSLGIPSRSACPWGREASHARLSTFSRQTLHHPDPQNTSRGNQRKIRLKFRNHTPTVGCYVEFLRLTHSNMIEKLQNNSASILGRLQRTDRQRPLSMALLTQDVKIVRNQARRGLLILAELHIPLKFVPRTQRQARHYWTSHCQPGTVCVC